MRYKIHPRCATPSPEVLEAFQGLAVADICDALGRNAALPSALRPIGCEHLLGPAYTVHLPASENLLLYHAAEAAKAGDVLVVACGGFTERAVTGEIMVSLMKKRGLAGLIVDGAVRDAAALRTLNFPVYARAISPNGPFKSACGAINVPVAMGNVVVCPGDIMVGDADGIVAVHREEAEEVIIRARAIACEAQKKLELINRVGTWDGAWIRERLAASGLTELEDANHLS